jgi:serine/threonine-protein kinase
MPTIRREDDVPEGEVLANQYRVERVLGAGGMGVVVRVRRVEDEQLFALKFLRPSVARDESAKARFLREAEAGRRIESAHVVRIFDVGTLASGSPYLLMEYLHGSTLEKLLGGGHALPLQASCDLILQLCEGLSAAHATGVIHRDIKPANLYLCTADGNASLMKIADFGISKILDDTQSRGLTRPQTSLGSPLYMSPEQMESASTADFRTDQWSLGAVLYRMVTAKLPFNAKSLPALCMQVMEGDFAPITTLCPYLPPEFAAATQRCLRVNPNERYADMAELAEALAPFASPESAAHVERCRALLRR